MCNTQTYMHRSYNMQKKYAHPQLFLHQLLKFEMQLLAVCEMVDLLLSTISGHKPQNGQKMEDEIFINI